MKNKIIFFAGIVLLVGVVLVIYLRNANPEYYLGIAMEPFCPSYSRLSLKPVTGLSSIKRSNVIEYKVGVIDTVNNRTDLKRIGRVVGLPGDTINIHNGKVFINNEQLDESAYINAQTQTLLPEIGGFIKENEDFMIQKDEYFLLGDNRPRSEDGRFKGTINRRDILFFVDKCTPDEEGWRRRNMLP